MSYTRTDTTEAVVLSPTGNADAAVVWLHGLGADGNDFVPIVPELRLPPSLRVRFIFPHAPLQPVTINGGYVMRSWYDIKGLSPDAPEDAAGIRRAATAVGAWFSQLAQDGIAARRIVIAGFSQGGAVALHTALRYPQRLAGVAALSTYLPLRSLVADEAAVCNRGLPILMCHGRDDDVLPYAFGKLSYDALHTLGYAAEWYEYPMRHEVCAAEVTRIGAWLSTALA
jgi:phospholipase/carboxylesterase